MPDVPTTPAAASSRKGAEGVVVVSSLVVLTFWGYRKLVEPGVSETKQSEPALAKIIGLEPKPASSAQFAIAFGFVFFTLSVGAMAAPELASAFAILVAVGYVLTNGQSVFADISGQLGAVPPGSAKGVKGEAYAGVPMTGPLRGVSGSSSAPATVAPNSARGVKGSSGPEDLAGLKGTSGPPYTGMHG